MLLRTRQHPEQRRPVAPLLTSSLIGTLVAATLVAATLLAAAPVLAPPAAQAAGQDLNFLLPPDEIERRITDEHFTIADWRGARAPGDRTQRVAIVFADDVLLPAQWATAPENGAEFNNEPRYELAAYRVQKLFLDPDEYVVPPTVIRSFPLAFVQEHVQYQRPTFREAPHSVLAVLQYWLGGVTPDNFWDSDRATTDSVYARHIGNMNILTVLIRHSDSNVGNFLISQNAANPRVFSVDNGVAFNSPPSDRGYYWRSMRVRRLPAHTVERLRSITREDLDRTLGVLVEFEVSDGLLVPVEPGDNMGAGRGVRRSRDRIQFGLSSREIGGIENRIRDLLRQVDSGRIEVF
jgi:hypothetical protein